MPKKNVYRVRNWREYNQALINRGNIIIWFEHETLGLWASEYSNGKRGRDLIYADSAIECALTIRSLFCLSLRKTRGFLEGAKTRT